MGAMLALTALALLAPSTAAAQSKGSLDVAGLLDYAPKKSSFVIGVNARKARSTVFFKETIKLVRSEPEAKQALSMLEERLGFVPERDMDALMFSSPSIDNPGQDRITIAISGAFDLERVKAEMKKEAKSTVGKLTVYTSDDGSSITFPSDKLMIISSGPSSYRDASMALAASKGASVKSNKKMRGLIDRAGADAHVWMAADTRKAKQPEGSPKLHDFTVGVDFSSGMKLNGVLNFASEDGAKKTLEGFEAERQQGAAMAAMIGAPSFMNNLKTSQKKSRVVFSTSMPDGEVRAVANFMRSMMEQAERERKAQIEATKKRLEEEKRAKEVPKKGPAPSQ